MCKRNCKGGILFFFSLVRIGTEEDDDGTICQQKKMGDDSYSAHVAAASPSKKPFSITVDKGVFNGRSTAPHQQTSETGEGMVLETGP